MDSDNQTNSNPNKRKKTDSSTDTDDLLITSEEVSLMSSINKKLEILIPLHKDVQEITRSLEFAHEHIMTLQTANKELHSSVQSLSEQMQKISTENKQLKETVLDLQTRSMRDNLIFSGLPETNNENTESVVKNFMKTQLKIPPETLKNVTFHRVHRFGRNTSTSPRPIVAKFEHFQDKLLVKGKGRELKGTTFGLNEQYPREINERRKVLYPIMKEHRSKNIRTSLIVDKLYINGQLFRNSKTTPWLF